jgi:hypothetical protein
LLFTFFATKAENLRGCWCADLHNCRGSLRSQKLFNFASAHRAGGFIFHLARAADQSAKMYMQRARKKRARMNAPLRRQHQILYMYRERERILNAAADGRRPFCSHAVAAAAEYHSLGGVIENSGRTRPIFRLIFRRLSVSPLSQPAIRPHYFCTPCAVINRWP